MNCESMSEDISDHRTTVDEHFPTPEEFGNQLQDAVAYLDNQQGSALSDPTEDNLAALRSRLSRKDFTEDNWKVELSPPLEVLLEPEGERDQTGIRDFANAEGYAQIGGLVSVENGEFAEYSFSLCILSQESEEDRSESEVDGEEVPCCWNETDSKWRVSRRLHFDVDTGRTDDEPKPAAHVQVGGKVSDTKVHSDYSDNEGYHYCDSPLDKPRVPYPPTDPVILLNMVIHQYPGIQSADQGSWRSIVVDSEELLWEPYHEFVRGVYTDPSRDPLPGRLSNDPAGD